MSASVYDILCKSVPNGDFSFQVPPIAMSMVVLLALGTAISISLSYPIANDYPLTVQG